MHTESDISAKDSRAPLVIRIRELRQERSLTQEELATALGLSRQSIIALESGRCLPSLPVAFQIANYFAMPLGALFDEMFEADSKLTTNPKVKENSMNYIVPFSPLREMREMLDGLMDETTNWPSPVAISAPAVNVSQTKKDVLLEMRLPGYKKEELNIEVGEDFITISGEANQESQSGEEEKQYFRREFVSQSFSRSLSLPAPVVSDQARAEMRHGVLHITLPKQVEEKPKTTKLTIVE